MEAEKSSGERKMRDAIAAVAGPRGWNETRESWLARAARRAGITCRTMKALWYGEIADPEHKAARRILEAAERDGRAEAQQLADKFEIIARGINATDPDFHSPDVAALLNAARILRGLDRSGTDGEE